jgi:tetratricopeptide (TPR) repeat protein
LGTGHGAFTYFVVRGLDGGVKPTTNSTVVLEDLMAYVRSNVRAWTKGEQNPTYRTTSPGMVVVADARVPPAGVIDGSAPKVEPVAEPVPAGGELPAVRQTRAQLLQHGQRGILQYLRGEQVLQTKEDFLACANAFAEAFRNAPDSAFTESRRLFCEGRALLFEKRWEEALRLLERCVRIDPARAYAYNALGIGYLERSRFDDAIAAFLDAASGAPNWAYPVHNLALVYEQTGDYEKAIELYRQAGSVANGASYPAYNLGVLLQRLNRVEEARSMYRDAIATGRTSGGWPNLAEAYNALGALEAGDQRPKRAKEHYEEALRLKPDLESSLHNLALLEATKLGQFERAEQRWKRLDNSADAAIRTAARFAYANELAHRGRQADSVAVYQRLLLESPTHSSARRALAMVQAEGGEIRSALRTASEGNDRALESIRVGLALWLDGKTPQDPALREIYQRRGKNGKRRGGF